MYFSPRDVRLMRTTGYLHNLGRITVTSEILGKQDKPAKAERTVLREHASHTSRMWILPRCAN
jgi:response regulator RpfG family c-di-GMP phosphodiesterase